MAIKLTGVGKSFTMWGRNRRPLYRELLMLRSQHHQAGAKVVLENVDLEIANGSRIAVIGHNGAGKSTLLRLIAGIYTPTVGTVRVDGRVCCFLEPGAGAAPSLPVIDNIFLYAALAGFNRKETQESLDRILVFSALEEQRYTWVEHLSFGMQQRLFMSIQLEAMRINRADVFLFDEFLMGVDKSFRARVEQAMNSFPNGDQIVLHASHDRELLIRTCPTGILVDDQGIKKAGSAEEVLDAYST